MKSEFLQRSRVRWLVAAITGIMFLPAAGGAEMPERNDATPNVTPAAGRASIAWNANSGQATLTNGRLELVVETQSGVNARSLRDLKNGQVYADRDYAWSGGRSPKMESTPMIADSKDGSRSITFQGQLGAIAVEQLFTLPKNQPGVIVEQITIRNPSDKSIETASFHCGFVRHLRDGATWSPDASEVRFCPVPYRRETNGQIQEFPLRTVAEHGTTYAGWESPQPTPVWGAEGWVWSKRSSVFLIAKHNPEGMEWSLMEPLKRGTETAVRFGGAGQWKHGHPESSARLDPGKSYQFGETRFQAIDGNWKQAFYAYRGFVEGNGCRTPQQYNPPVHWNELYDNEYYPKVCALADQYFFKSNRGFCPEFYERNERLLNEYYSLKLMKAEAAKAKELGCEALYLDPGWDTGPSHQIWDAVRLGSMESFVKQMKEEYDLKAVSLWCSVGGVPPTIGDPSACPKEARVINKDGRSADLLVCFASPAYLDTKEKRLLELCRNGAAFLMFDSTQYSGPCYDKTHSHQIPSTREDHARALLELTRRVKTKYPHVLIEMHDFISGPGGNHYTPTYYGYAKPYSFDCLWGHEFMWNSMDDLLSGRAVSLYYYNLAYSIPLYLHVSLKPDNQNALVFWWYASTCRHLGMGGKSSNPAVWAAHRNAMRMYLRLKQFYTRGVFYGIDETVHAHTLPDLRESVLNVFNLTDKPEEKEVQFRPADIGLPTGLIQIEGASLTLKGDKIAMKTAVPAHGQKLIKVKTR
jgi:hypothetical protein